MDSSASNRLYAELKKTIVSPSSNIGDKMPTEQSLCKEYGVGRSTVREALRMLGAIGLLEIRRGSGAYIASKTDPVTQGQGWIVRNKDSIQDYMEVRTAIETLAIKLFIVRQGEALGMLEEIQEKFEYALAEDNIEMASSQDLAFHEAIADNSGNAMLSQINRLIQKEFNIYREITFQEKLTRMDAIVAHRKIIDAARRQSTDDAVFAIQMHLKVSMDNAIMGIVG